MRRYAYMGIASIPSWQNSSARDGLRGYFAAVSLGYAVHWWTLDFGWKDGSSCY
jgi:hypothetical protein